jgi:hypothetical protein
MDETTEEPDQEQPVYKYARPAKFEPNTGKTFQISIQ